MIKIMHMMIMSYSIFSGLWRLTNVTALTTIARDVVNYIDLKEVFGLLFL